MDWYAITDSDWNWDTDDGGAPFIAYAETPEEAIQQALEAWKKPDGGWDFDGVQVKVAIMKTIGFQSIDIRNGAAVKEPFLKIPVPDDAAIRAELIAALRAMMEGSTYGSFEVDGQDIGPVWRSIRMPSEDALNKTRAALEKAGDLP